MQGEVTEDMKNVMIAPELVIMNLKAESSEEVLDLIANRLVETGCVKESYVEAVKKRETVFPTGLPVEEMGIALPHTDSVHVNKQAIAVGILEKTGCFYGNGNRRGQGECGSGIDACNSQTGIAG